MTDQSRLFFVHIQKTAGGTLRQHIKANVGPGEIYPAGAPYDDEPLDAYWTVPRLLSLPEERRDMIRAYVGHFPYIACELLDLELVTMTVLRNPIERSISYLKMRSEAPEREGMTLEQIYEDPFDYWCFVHNHQAKIFSMTPDDRLETFMDVIEVDRDRLEIAKENLQKVDIIGLQEHYDEMLQEVGRRFGWPMDEVDDIHVSGEGYEFPESLRERIAEDNANDVEFYEFAQQLYRERAHARAQA